MTGYSCSYGTVLLLQQACSAATATVLLEAGHCTLQCPVQCSAVSFEVPGVGFPGRGAAPGQRAVLLWAFWGGAVPLFGVLLGDGGPSGVAQGGGGWTSGWAPTPVGVGAWDR